MRSFAGLFEDIVKTAIGHRLLHWAAQAFKSEGCHGPRAAVVRD